MNEDCSPNVIRVIRSRRMGWAELVARMGDRRYRTGFWYEELREGDHLQDPGVDGKLILKWIFKKLDGGMDQIDLALDRSKLRDLVNAVMNLRVP